MVLFDCVPRRLAEMGADFKNSSTSNSTSDFDSAGDGVNSRAAGRSCWSGALSESTAGRAACSGRGCCRSVAEKRCKVMSCAYTEESAIITSSHTAYFHVIIQNYLKSRAAGRCCGGDAALRWLGLVLGVTAGRELQACWQADLTEKLKAWHFETIGWAA